MLAIVNTNKNQLSLKGQLAVGIRRNLSNIAAGDFGKVVLEQMSRQTVIRAEVAAGEATLDQTKRVFDDKREAAALYGADQIEVFTATSDATNSAIWQKRKLSTLELSVAFLTDPHSCVWSWEEAKGLADLLPVEDSTGRGTLAMIVKHMCSLACENILDIAEDNSNVKANDPFLLDPDFDPCERENTQPLRIFQYTSDEGSDQKKARSLLFICFRDSNKVWIIDTSCLHHQGHLVSKASLKLCDRFLMFMCNKPYYSTTTKIVYSWRGNSKYMYRRAIARFGVVWAYENMYTLCPKCSSSRWQGIDVAEKRILKVTCRKLNVCLSDVLENKYKL